MTSDRAGQGEGETPLERYHRKKREYDDATGRTITPRNTVEPVSPVSVEGEDEREWTLLGAKAAYTAEQAVKGEFRLRTAVESGPQLAEDEAIVVVPKSRLAASPSSPTDRERCANHLSGQRCEREAGHYGLHEVAAELGGCHRWNSANVVSPSSPTGPTEGTSEDDVRLDTITSERQAQLRETTRVLKAGEPCPRCGMRHADPLDFLWIDTFGKYQTTTRIP